MAGEAGPKTAWLRISAWDESLGPADEQKGRAEFSAPKKWPPYTRPTGQDSPKGRERPLHTHSNQPASRNLPKNSRCVTLVLPGTASEEPVWELDLCPTPST